MSGRSSQRLREGTIAPTTTKAPDGGIPEGVAKQQLRAESFQRRYKKGLGLTPRRPQNLNQNATH